MKLYNGVEIPNIGLGTWLIKNKKVSQVVVDAIKIGYRHIDTAQAYQNEKGVGTGIIASGIKRSDVFITSKIKAEIKNYKDAKKSIEETLKKLNTNYVDLMLIHCPVPWSEYNSRKHNYYQENIEVWHALEEAYNDGKIRAIGVSNFEIHDLENIINNCKIKPMVNQVSAHPFYMPFALIEYCKKNDIVFEAYSPLAHGKAKDIDKVNEIANKNTKSFAQICLKYLLNKNLVVLPKASSVEHLESNFDLDFVLSDEDMKYLE